MSPDDTSRDNKEKQEKERDQIDRYKFFVEQLRHEARILWRVS